VRVLGVDPGSGTTGWGVVERSGRKIEYLASGTIQTRGSRSFAARLQRIYEGIRVVLKQWRPHAVGLEGAFVARNVQAAFRLGEARGAVLVGAAVEGVDVYEYAPAAVKLAVAGSGRADKEQVGLGVARLLGIRGATIGKDASDALAVAVCHLHSVQLSGRLQVALRETRATPASRLAARRRRGLRDIVAPACVEQTVIAGRARRPRVARRRLG